jgi:hypothetical protein
MKKAKPNIGELSFVASRDGKTLPKATGDQLPRCFWNVAVTGNIRQDDNLGHRLALEYLAFEEADDGGGNLQLIVSDMPRRLTMVEISFLTMVSLAAAAGAFRARQIAKYWDEMNAQEETVADAKATKRRRPSGRAA